MLVGQATTPGRRARRCAGRSSESWAYSKPRMTGPKITVSSVHVYQAIAFVALLATLYVTRWKVMGIAALVAIVVALASSRLYHITRRD